MITKLGFDIEISKSQTQKTGTTENKESTQATSDSIMDSSFYQDTNSLSIEEAFNKINSSSLFNQSVKITQSKHDMSGLDKMLNGQRGKAVVDIDADGTFEQVDMAEAIANSFDSELDLYIQEQLVYAVKTYGSATDDTGFLGEDSLEYLRSKGIIANNVMTEGGLENKVWSFSLVDENGNILEDENGAKGSIIFADGLNADGYAQGVELELSSILDQLGYDCISKADFIGNEEEYQKTLQQVEEKINSGQYQGKDSIEDVYGELGVYIRGRFKDKNELATLAALQAEGSMKKDKDGLDNALEKLYNQKLEAAIQKYKTENDGVEPTGSEYDSIVQSIGQELSKTYEQEDIIAAQQQIVKPVVK